jgi:CshA-type fibril repeat protein
MERSVVVEHRVSWFRRAAWSRSGRPRTWGSRLRRPAAVALVSAIAAAPLFVPGPPASAYEIPGGAWTGTAPGGTSAVGTLPAGTTMTATTTGAVTVNSVNFNPSASYGATSAMFAPGITTTSPATQILTGGNGCAASGVCADRGTVTLTFSRPVRNPVLHVAGIGGANSQTLAGVLTNSSAIHSRATLTGSSPAGATFGSVSGGAVNLVGTGTQFETSNYSNSAFCGTTSAGGLTFAAVAGCGSIPVNGTVTSLTLNLDIVAQVILGAGYSGQPGSGDGWSLTFTADEDFGDAPVGYEAGAPAAHVIGDLTLGSSVDRENSTTPNGGTTAGGLSVTGGADANSPNGDGADDNGVASFPPLTTDRIGGTYSVPVSLSGASAAGRVCGWIDFDRSGLWDAVGERACADFAPGATSATLTWNVTGGTAGRTYARIRTSYNPTQAQSPTGLADSGEVEDYTLEMKPSVIIIKTVLPATDPGRFNLGLFGIPYATNVSNGGTTGFLSVYNNTAISAPNFTTPFDVQTGPVPITASEFAGTGTDLNNYLDSTSCVSGTGASFTGNFSIPQSSSASGGNGRAQTFVCTITNRRRISFANDTASTPSDTTVTVPVLGNDAATGGQSLVPASVVVLDPADGTYKATVTVPSEGTYTVNPATGQVSFDPLPAFSGVATPVTYRAADTGGATATATITVTVAASAPTANPDTASTPQDVTVLLSPLTNDSAGTSGVPLDPATLQLRDPADGVYKASVTIPGEGTYTVNPATGQVSFDPIPTFTGTATSLTYLVANTAGTSTTSTITVTVTPIVPVAVPDAASTPSDTTVTIPVLGNDAAGGPSAPLVPGSVRLRDPATGTYGTSVTVPGEGTYTANPDGSVTFDPLPAFSGVATPVTYRVADDNGTTVTSTVTVTVSGPPVANPDVGTTPQNVDVTVSPLENDAPGSNGGAPLDPASVRLRDPATGTYGTSVTIPGEGTYTANPDGTVTFDPLPTFTGAATPVTYRVADDDGFTVTSTITITVAPIVPVADADVASTPSDTTVTLPVLGNDAAGGPSAPLVPGSVRLLDPATGTYGTSVTIPGEGTYTANPDGSVTFDPLQAFSGVATPVTYRVADANGTTVTSTVTVTVTGPPTANPDTATTPQDVPVLVSPSLNDTAGTSGSPVDPASARLLDPATGTYGTSVTIPGEGTYTVNPDGTVAFDPVPAFTGAATPVTYQIADQDGVTARSTIAITVTPVVPIARDDTATTPFDTAVTVPVLGNDVAGDPSAPLVPGSVRLLDPADGTYRATVTIPGEGTYTVNPDGSVTFDPGPTFSGVATPVTYRVADDNGTTVTSALTITVSGPPAANPDADSTPQNVDVTIDPLANDTPGGNGGAPLDPASVRVLDPAAGTYGTSVTVPGEGTYTVNPATGQVTFDPVPAFTGVATPVTYRIADEDGITASSTITVTVAGIDPVAAPDTVTTAQDVTTAIDVLANDAPGAGSALLDPASVRLLDPATGTYGTSVTIPGEGTYTANPDGTVTFDPVPAFTGITTPVTYEVRDANGTRAQSSITVVVTPIVPVAVPDAASTPSDTTVTIPVLGNDAAGGPSAPLVPGSVRLRDPATGTYGTSVTVPGEGTYAANPDGSVAFDPLPAFSGVATPVTYRVADDNGTTVTSTVTVTVSGPPVANPDVGTTPQNVDVTVSPLENDAPGSNGGAPLDPASVRLRDPATGTYGTSVTIPGEGTYTANPDGTVTFDPLPTFTGAATPVTYRVADDDGFTVTSTITITVAPIVPVADADVASTPSDTTVTLPVLGNDAAGGPSAPLVPGSVRLLDPATGTYGTSVTIPGEGTYTANPDGSVTFDPLPAFSGVATPVTYRVADANGTTVTAPVTITVSGPPDANPDTATTLQDVTVTLNPLTNDTPGSNGGAPLDPASARLLDPATGTYGTSVTSPGEGTYTVNPDGTVAFDPVPAFTGAATPVTYQVADLDGITVTSTVTVTVAPVTPIAVDDAGSAPSGRPIVVDILANDRAGAPSAPLVPTSVQLRDPADGTYRDTVLVAGVGSYAVDPGTGAVTFTPDPAFAGVAPPLTYRVADENGTFATATLTVTTGEPPRAVDDTATTGQGRPVVVNPLANDEPGSSPLDPATVRLVDPITGDPVTTVTVPGEGTWTVNPATGAITFAPEPTFTGAATPLTYRVSDQDGLPASADVAVTVTPQPPVARPNTATTDQGLPVTVDVLGNDTASPGLPLDPASVQMRDPATGGSVARLTVAGEGVYQAEPDGRVTFAPDPLFSGQATPVTYRVKDTVSREVASTLAVTVNASRIARDDTATGPPGRPIVVDVLRNDTIVPGVPLDRSTLRLVSPATGDLVTRLVVPGEGVWTVDTDRGVLIFTPERGFAGVVSPVTYYVEDVEGRSTTGRVTVRVAGVTEVVPGPLAATGTEVAALGLGGLTLVGAGALVIATTRRRRRDSVPPVSAG